MWFVISQSPNEVAGQKCPLLLFVEITMAIDVYLQIDGIKGESADSAH
jgi:hypothetical protein